MDPEEELEEGRILEIEARKELEDDRCPPCYPPDLEFPLRNPPEEYEAIIEYWMRDDVVLCGQKVDWEKFRRDQNNVRNRNRPFSNFVDQVRERRQRHGLSGRVHLSLNRTQQSQLDDWIEFQNYHLIHLEKFEKERDEFKQKLEDERKVAGDRTSPRPKFGYTRAETFTMRLDYAEQKLKSYLVLLDWIEQQRLAMDPGDLTPIIEDQGDQDQNATPKAIQRDTTCPRSIKKSEGPSILGKVRITKADPKKRKIQNSSAQKLKAAKLEPLVRNSDIIPQNSLAQGSQHLENNNSENNDSENKNTENKNTDNQTTENKNTETKHPETGHRHTKTERPLRQLHPQRVAKADRDAGVKAKSFPEIDHKTALLRKLGLIPKPKKRRIDVFSQP